MPNQNRKRNDILLGINKTGQQKLNFTKKKDILSHVSTAHFPSNLNKNPPNSPISKTLQDQNLLNSETLSSNIQMSLSKKANFQLTQIDCSHI